MDCKQANTRSLCLITLTLIIQNFFFFFGMTKRTFSTLLLFINVIQFVCMNIWIFIDFPKGWKASTPFIHFFYIFSLFSRIYILLPFSHYFLHISYCLYYILSHFLFYPNFLRTPRSIVFAFLLFYYYNYNFFIALQI